MPRKEPDKGSGKGKEAQEPRPKRECVGITTFRLSVERDLASDTELKARKRKKTLEQTVEAENVRKAMKLSLTTAAEERFQRDHMAATGMRGPTGEGSSRQSHLPVMDLADVAVPEEQDPLEVLVEVLKLKPADLAKIKAEFRHGTKHAALVTAAALSRGPSFVDDNGSSDASDSNDGNDSDKSGSSKEEEQTYRPSMAAMFKWWDKWQKLQALPQPLTQEQTTQMTEAKEIFKQYKAAQDFVFDGPTHAREVPLEDWVRNGPLRHIPRHLNNRNAPELVARDAADVQRMRMGTDVDKVETTTVAPHPFTKNDDASIAFGVKNGTWAQTNMIRVIAITPPGECENEYNDLGEAITYKLKSVEISIPDADNITEEEHGVNIETLINRLHRQHEPFANAEWQGHHLVIWLTSKYEHEQIMVYKCTDDSLALKIPGMDDVLIKHMTKHDLAPKDDEDDEDALTESKHDTDEDMGPLSRDSSQVSGSESEEPEDGSVGSSFDGSSVESAELAADYVPGDFDLSDDEPVSNQGGAGGAAGPGNPAPHCMVALCTKRVEYHTNDCLTGRHNLCHKCYVQLRKMEGQRLVIKCPFCRTITTVRNVTSL